MDKRKKPHVHGTVGGHTKHRRLGETPCEECRAAFNEYNKKYQKDNIEKIKEYRRITQERLLADPEKLAARKEYHKKFRKPYDYQANKEYQKWYYENVRKLKR
jgi:hypothetical protein